MFQKYLALWEDPKYHCGLRKKAEKNCKVEEDKDMLCKLINFTLKRTDIFFLKQ